MGKSSKIKQQSVESRLDADTELQSISGYKVTLTALVVLIIAAVIAFYINPLTSFAAGNASKKENAVHSKEHIADSKTQKTQKKPKLNVAKAKRKLNWLNEYEDLFDHSAEISNWDTYRPPNVDSELSQLFALYDKREYLKAKHEFQYALNSNQRSFWARYGAAISADKLAEEEKTNQLLEEGIEFYGALCDLRLDVSKMSVVERDAELAACRRMAERLSFRGWSKRALDVLSDLSERYPNQKSIHHDVAIQLIMTGQHAKAKRLLEMLLNADPDDGFAAVHMGFILKTIENDFVNSIPHLIKGLQSGAPGVKDGRFYYHLGDALVRLGRAEEAEKWYEEGYRNGVFLAPDQRSLYSVADLRAQPWWPLSETGHEVELKTLMANWQDIKREGLANLDKETGLFKPEDEKLRDYGDWKQLTLFQRGSKVAANCQKAPITCSLIDRFPDAAGCRRGQVKFSVMKPKTHVWPHTGPTNCRLRAHLGLKVPDETYITVAKQTKQWEEGKIIVLDDSFEHEVWHNGTEDRLILIIDFWHPQLNAQQKSHLKQI